MNKRVRGIIIDNGKILLMYRYKNGMEYWVVPGGGIEAGESEIEALMREMKEETNLDVTVGRKVMDDVYNGVDVSYYMIDKFDGKLELGGPEKEQLSQENVYLPKWVDISVLNELTLYPEKLKEIIFQLL